ncbi:MAG: hypothetical protein WD696_19410 [Bryobacteraceae bacterium]
MRLHTPETTSSGTASVYGSMTVLRLVCVSLLSLGVLCGQPLDSMLVLETSPGTEHTTGLIHPRAFEGAGRAGVIGFQRTARVLLPLTEDRDELADALQRAGVRVGVGMGGVQINSNLTVDLVAALKQACGEFGRDDSTERKRAVIVFFGSEDPNLSANLDTLKAALSGADARLYGIAVQRVAGRETPVDRWTRTYPFPAITARLMSELAEESGGKIFKSTWDLRKILAAARKP